MDYVLANWKMYPSADEAAALLDAIQAGLRDRAAAGHPLPVTIVCPPFVALPQLRAIADGAVVRLGAQTCHWEQEGPYTGDVSPRMLRGLAEYVLVGHSERRAAGETDDHVARKVAAAVHAGLVPLLFVGEDDPGEGDLDQTEDRVRRGLSLVDVVAHEVLVVYEPHWAVGAENAAPAAHVRRAVEHVKGVLAGLGAARPTVLYGGAVSDDDVEDLAALDVLDGVGATRASLDADRFLRLVDRLGTDRRR